MTVALDVQRTDKAFLHRAGLAAGEKSPVDQ